MIAKMRRIDQLPAKRDPFFGDPTAGDSKGTTMNVIENTQTGNRPFGFSRALQDEEPVEEIPGDGWDDHAAALAG